MQHIESAQALVTRDDIRGGITLRMANMQTCAARIGKHIQDVKFRLRGIETFLTGIRHVKELSLFPDGLPFWFELVEGIGFAALAHGRPLTLNHEWTRMNTNSRKNVAACQLSPSWVKLFIAAATIVGKAHGYSC